MKRSRLRSLGRKTMRGLGPYGFGLALVGALAGIATFAKADQHITELPIEKFPAWVYKELADRDLTAHAGTQPPCLANAIKILFAALEFPSQRSRSGVCPHCGMPSTAAPGEPCKTCGETAVSGISQTGVGTAETALSYDMTGSVPTGSTGKVTGSITRTSSVNGKIEANVSVMVTFRGECSAPRNLDECASFRATAGAKVSYVESDDHRYVSQFEIGNITLRFDSLSCCQQYRSNIPYTVTFATPDIPQIPLVTQGNQTLQTPAPARAEHIGTAGKAAAAAVTPTPTPASPPPINKDPQFQPWQPCPDEPTRPDNYCTSPSLRTATNLGTDYGPATSSLHGEVLVTAATGGTYQGSASEFVDVVDATGTNHMYAGKTDRNGHLTFLPQIAGLAAPVVAVHVYHALADGTLSSGSTTTITNSPPDLPGSQPVENAPHGAASSISRASSVVDSHGNPTTVLEYQTTGTNATSRVLVNGSASLVDTVAASDQSVVAVARVGTGLNRIAIETNGISSNVITQAVVATRFAPLPALHTGQTAQFTEYVSGAEGLRVVARVTISGAATFADGTTSKWLSTTNGVLSAPIRAGNPGPLDINAELFVETPTFTLPPGGPG
jgi:hypothetical protein